MADYVRLLTVNDRVVPLAELQRAAGPGVVWSVDHPGVAGNYLAVGPSVNDLPGVWATIERNVVGPETLAGEEVADFLGRIEEGGPRSAAGWLADYLGRVRTVYAIRLFPGATAGREEAAGSVHAVRAALRHAVGGIGQWDGYGFTNEAEQLVWCDPAEGPRGKTRAAVLDPATGQWDGFDLDLDDPSQLRAFVRGEKPGG